MCFVINKVAKPILGVRVTYTSRTIIVLFLMEIIDLAEMLWWGKKKKQAEREEACLLQSLAESVLVTVLWR